MSKKMAIFPTKWRANEQLQWGLSHLPDCVSVFQTWQPLQIFGPGACWFQPLLYDIPRGYHQLLCLSPEDSPPGHLYLWLLLCWFTETWNLFMQETLASESSDTKTFGQFAPLCTWIFQICKISAFWLVFWVKRHKFYILGRSRYQLLLCLFSMGGWESEVGFMEKMMSIETKRGQLYNGFFLFAQEFRWIKHPLSDSSETIFESLVWI